MNANDQYEYPYHYTTRKLTIDELHRLRIDLVAVAAYTTKYHSIFEHPDVNWGEELDAKYDQIQDTLQKILRRGIATEHYNPLQQTPLLLADVYVYLWEVIDFTQYRTNPRNVSQIDPETVSPEFHADEQALIRMEADVLKLIAALVPPATNLHAEISKSVHRAVYGATR
jgi:hypothetical protein